jgi:hypothetical protein
MGEASVLLTLTWPSAPRAVPSQGERRENLERAPSEKNV